MNRGTSQRTRERPLGDEQVPSCRWRLSRIYPYASSGHAPARIPLLDRTPHIWIRGRGNVLTARTVLLAMLATSLGAHWHPAGQNKSEHLDAVTHQRCSMLVAPAWQADRATRIQPDAHASEGGRLRGESGVQVHGCAVLDGPLRCQITETIDGVRHGAWPPFESNTIEFARASALVAHNLYH
jgi:hypothetical protein